MISPTSAAGSQAGVSRQNEPAGAERGSEHSHRRRLSSTVFRWCSLSAIVAPGMFNTPPVMTRPISPAQWTSTVWRVREKRMAVLSETVHAIGRQVQRGCRAGDQLPHQPGGGGGGSPASGNFDGGDGGSGGGGSYVYDSDQQTGTLGQGGKGLQGGDGGPAWFNQVSTAAQTAKSGGAGGSAYYDSSYDTYRAGAAYSPGHPFSYVMTDVIGKTNWRNVGGGWGNGAIGYGIGGGPVLFNGGTPAPANQGIVIIAWEPQ